jgi:hypothetical protein
MAKNQDNFRNPRYEAVLAVSPPPMRSSRLKHDLASQATRASRTGPRTVQSMSKRQFCVICNSGCIFAHCLVVAAVCIAGCGG